MIYTLHVIEDVGLGTRYMLQDKDFVRTAINMWGWRLLYVIRVRFK